jgi:S-methylmethionine-dependent homocysteine/selenocysteine methylase
MLVVLDGAMGTEIARRGVATPPRGWSANANESAPDTVATIHRDYAIRGATVHTANTFRTRRRDVGEAWERLARRAVAIARASVPPGHRVAGSLGPLEDCYRPDRSPGVASRPEHRELAQLLAGAGADLLLCETFPDPTEAAVAVEEAAATGVPTWVALTAGPDGSLMTPERMRRAARGCIDAGALTVLVNCVAATRTLPYVEALAGLGVPFGAYANAGDEGDRIGWGAADEPAAAAAYEALAASWVDAGATRVGGCCGTGPAHVARLTALAARRPGHS